MANHYMAAIKLDRREEEGRETKEMEKEMTEDGEDRGVEKEAVPSRRESVSSGQETVRRESVSSGRETVGSVSGSRLFLQSQPSLSRMSEEYLNKGALDVLLVAVFSVIMLYVAFSRLVHAHRYY